MEQYFDEIKPKDFYRDIFTKGNLQDKGDYEKGRYNAIAIEITDKKRTNGKTKINRYTITDDLDMIDELVTHKGFVLMSPVTYAGKSRKAENARFIYALAIDLDGISKEQQIKDLFYQIDGGGPGNFIPRPTYVVSSGNGVHLYYVFEKPIPCFGNINKQLHNLKQALTKKIWNDFITDDYNRVQYQSIFQGFRLVGSMTKNNTITRVFEIGSKVSIDYLNEYVDEKNRLTEFKYKTDLTLDQAKEKYPEWYEKRVVNKQKKGTWVNKRALYDWWKRKLQDEVVEGHRYYGLMCLAIYAKKCNIAKEELEDDAFMFMDILEAKTESESNHFTEDDVLAALEMFNDDYITFPIDTISQLTNVRIDKNKRNGRTQEVHIKTVNAMRQFRRDILGEDEYKNNGRPTGSSTKEQLVRDYIEEHPIENPTQIARALGISRPTVYKYMK